jgi:ABC-type antimicrobial peptide transport system permease subunit
MAYVVSQRMREFGIRIALGAGGVHIFESVVVRAAWMIGAGAAVGVVASFATNKLISHQIWSVARFDGVALASSIAVIVVLGLGACCFPALRAMRADAGVVLREE